VSLSVGTRVGPFEILGLLGSGGMGEVYRARDVRLGRQVAVKVLPAGLSGDRERLIRFAHEARSASALSHPHIVVIYEVGQAGTLPFIAMELIEGETLRAILERGPLAFRKAAGIGFQIADGLAKAHSAGIVHRDLKPENVMVNREGYAKILDFGLAKLAGAGPGAGPASMTATGFVLGTAGYMSPEQASGGAVDFRSDQFSLGLILYEMVTGRRAFSRSTAVQTLSAIIQDDPEPIESLNPRVPSSFRWLVDRCLAKDPEDRYASTRDLARDLEHQRDSGPAGPDLSEGMAPAPPAATPVTTEVGRAASSAPAPSLPHRALSLGASVIAAVILFAAGLAAGFWIRTAIVEPPAETWRGDLVLGGSIRAFAPRISPDGQTLAFVTPEAGIRQVAVVKPGTGDWIVLTHQRARGAVERADWSRDGTRIVFDRVGDDARAIYSVPALGGEERLMLDDAQTPESLPDGSLLVVRIEAGDRFRISRFWPESGRLAPIGPPILRDANAVGVRAFPDGREAIFYGRIATTTAPAARQAYVLDLASGAVRRFAPGLPLSPPVTIGADGASVIADIVTGDLHRITRIGRGGASPSTLLTVPSRPWYINESVDGSLYVEFIDNRAELLRFPAAGGIPERLASVGRYFFMEPVQLSDGRVLLPAQSSGRRKLLVAAPGEAPRSFIETSDQASPPVALVGNLLAFVGGAFTADSPPVITLATQADGRITRRLESTRGVVCAALAGSADGSTVYYVDSGWVWSVPSSGGAPLKLRQGNAVAVDPAGGDLVVQINDRAGIRLARWTPGGGPERPIPFHGNLRLTASPIAGNALSPDGKLVISVSGKDLPFTSPAILDVATGEVVPVPLRYEGDVLPSSWGVGGMLLGVGADSKTDLWRFRPDDAKR
jgi:hypothetical protein